MRASLQPTPSPAGSLLPPSGRALGTALLLLLALGLIPLLWPGDTGWVNDEPMFLREALRARQGGALASHGLVGTRALVYGPFAIWIYTGLLHFTNDLVQLMVMRAMLCMAGTIVGLIWIARLCRRLLPVLAGLALLSPYLWMYSRPLWDNSFLIPLSALTLASYVSFSVAPARWKLWVTVIGGTCMFLLHLMSVTLMLPIVLHALVYHRPWLREHRRTLLLQGLVALLLSSPYLIALVQSVSAALHRLGTVAAHPPPAVPVVAPTGGPTLPPDEPFKLFKWQGWVFPLLSGRYFSAFGLDYFFGAGWTHADRIHDGGLIAPLAKLTYLSLPLVWIGLILAGLRVRRGRRQEAPRDADFHMSWLVLASLAVQTTLYGLMQIYGHPHYYNPTWICAFYCLWSALSLEMESPIGRWLMFALRGLLAMALGAVLAFLILRVHRNAGNRDIHYGTPIGHQLEMARRIARYHPESPLRIEVPNYLFFPHALTVLRQFYGLTGDPKGPRRALRLRLQNAIGDDGWLALDELPASEPAPPSR